MGSIRTVENIAKLVKLTVSTLQLPASRINIGAKQYVTSALTLDKSVTGVGGCDVAVAAGSLYYVYAVVSSNVVYLIASLSSSLPAGFTQARKVGAFTTGATSQILEAFYYGQVLTPGEWQSYAANTPTNITLGNGNQQSWWKRAGADVVIQVRVQLGTTSTINGSVSFNNCVPSGLSVDTNNKPASPTQDYQLVGYGYVFDYSTNNTYTGAIRRDSGASIYLTISGTTVLNAIIPVPYGDRDAINVNMSLPIAEWAGSGTQFVW